MRDREYQVWWILIVLGVLFLGTTVSGIFDPTEDTTNPYNYIELYAETPGPENVQNWIAVFIGFLGILSVVQLEFAFSESRAPRALKSPIHLFLFICVCVGFLLFALYRVCGPYAIVLQAVPFAMAHIGKPELETLSCIFGGSAFGYVAWRTRSFLYPFLIHWFLLTITVVFAGGVS